MFELQGGKAGINGSIKKQTNKKPQENNNNNNKNRQEYVPKHQEKQSA